MPEQDSRTTKLCRNAFYYPDAIKGSKEEVSEDKKIIKKNYYAYLDIETTSLNLSNGDLTVIGLCLEDGNELRIIQLVEDEISASKLMKIMENVKLIYTYNGTKFDLPYVNAKVGLDLTRYCIHKDLMYECWRQNLYGGFKEVERKLDIKRKLRDVDGRVAVQLWHK